MPPDEARSHRYARQERKGKGETLQAADGGGLYLLVKPTGSKLWRYKYRIAGREGTFAIGAYPSLSLANARAEHAKARDLVNRGMHPRHQRETEKLKVAIEAGNTFRAIAEVWYLATGLFYQRLVGDAAASPIVTERGDRNQLTYGIGVG